MGFSSRKVNRHVDFPFVLDLAPFCSSLCQVSDVVNTSTSTLEIVIYYTVKLHHFIMIVKCYTDQKKKLQKIQDNYRNNVTYRKLVNYDYRE